MIFFLKGSSWLSARGRLALATAISSSRSDRRVFRTMGNAATAKKGNELESGESATFSGGSFQSGRVAKT